MRLNSKFLNNIPEERREMTIKMFESFSPVKVNIKLNHNDELPISGGISIIHTPGHTPGHIGIYHHESKTLIIGDAMNITNGQLYGPKKEILDDKSYKLALESLKKLLEYDIKNVIAYHGGLFNNNPNQRIKEILE